MATVAGDGSATVTEVRLGIVTEPGVVPGTEMNSVAVETVSVLEFGIAGGNVVGLETRADYGDEIVPETAVGAEIVVEAVSGAEIEIVPREQHRYYKVPAPDVQGRSEKHKVALV